MRCQSGIHEWNNAACARRCCAPGWRLELRLDAGDIQPGDDEATIVFLSRRGAFFVFTSRPTDKEDV